ncbi:MAG: ArsA-related P-loop ATPase [Ilumatobacteraceae bacterium]
MTAAQRALAELVGAKEMVVVCGSGGVGKTTTAAALGAAVAAAEKCRVLVLTVDPARRLATALGMDAIGNAEIRVGDESFAAAGIQPRGELWVAMLDTKAGWDELIRRHAPDSRLRDSVLANPLYRNLTSRFVHSHGYIAIERLLELHASGRYDLVVVDTPPSRNALDLLDSPGRMREFFGSRLLKWLTVPYRSRLFNLASKPFNQIADRVLGSSFLQDIAQFFTLFQKMEPGFVRRATQVEQLLSDQRTTFLVVSTLEPAPAHEAGYLASEISRRRLPLGALVLNRVLSPAIRARATSAAATKMAALVGDGKSLKKLSTASGVPVPLLTSTLDGLADSFSDLVAVAKREAERRSELSAQAKLIAEVPMLDGDITDLDALLRIGRHLIGGETP